MQHKFKDIRYNRISRSTKGKYQAHIAFLTVNGNTESVLLAELKKRHPKEDIELLSFER